MPGTQLHGRAAGQLAAGARWTHTGAALLTLRFSRAASSFAAMPLLPTQQQQLDEAELVQHLIMLQAQQRQGGKEHKAAGSFRVDRLPKGHIGGEVSAALPRNWRLDITKAYSCIRSTTTCRG